MKVNEDKVRKLVSKVQNTFEGMYGDKIKIEYDGWYIVREKGVGINIYVMGQDMVNDLCIEPPKPGNVLRIELVIKDNEVKAKVSTFKRISDNMEPIDWATIAVALLGVGFLFIK